MPKRPAWKSKRPAPRKVAGPPTSVHDDVVWTRQIEPRERYRIVYIDRNDERSEREIELLRIGEIDGTPYLGVMHLGRFKTMRADRVVGVEQLSEGHASSLVAAPTYATEMPPFPLEKAVYRMATIAVSKRTWTVDLNAYRCSCPEARLRSGFGYAPGQLGFCCPHMARAIVAYLPTGADGWSPDLLAFLRDPRRTHIDNLS